MRTIPLERCPSCAAADRSQVLIGAQALVRCDVCGLVYAGEYADPDEIYVDGYLQGGQWGPPNVLEPGFARRLADLNRMRMEIIGRVHRPGTLLDVGCGMGELLVAARAAGWEGVGVEPVAASAEYARAERGLDVRTGMLAEVDLDEGTFDVVTATHVLEHMPDGHEFLTHIARWARPGGYVVIEVPNFGSFQRRHDGERWVGLRPLEHVAHYTPATLRAAFRRAGLRPVLVRSPSYVWSESTLMQALIDLGLRRLDGPLRRFCTVAERDGEQVFLPRRPLWAILRSVETVMTRLGKGSLILGVAQRPVTS